MERSRCLFFLSRSTTTGLELFFPRQTHKLTSNLTNSVNTAGSLLSGMVTSPPMQRLATT